MEVEKKMDIVDSLMEESNVVETLCRKDSNSEYADPGSLFLLVEWQGLTVNVDADHLLQLLKLPMLEPWQPNRLHFCYALNNPNHDGPSLHYSTPDWQEDNEVVVAVVAYEV